MSCAVRVRPRIGWFRSIERHRADDLRAGSSQRHQRISGPDGSCRSDKIQDHPQGLQTFVLLGSDLSIVTPLLVGDCHAFAPSTRRAPTKQTELLRLTTSPPAGPHDVVPAGPAVDTCRSFTNSVGPSTHGRRHESTERRPSSEWGTGMRRRSEESCPRYWVGSKQGTWAWPTGRRGPRVAGPGAVVAAQRDLGLASTSGAPTLERGAVRVIE